MLRTATMARSGRTAAASPRASTLRSGRAAPLRGRAPRTIASAAAGAAPSGAPRTPTLADKREFNENLATKPKEFLRARREENAAGAFWVDNSCIDCQTCRWVAPATFGAVGQQAAVLRQPETQEERVAALQALLSCPVYSIHTDARAPEDLKAAQAALPRPWPTAAPGVYHCGWHSEASFGGAGWLLTRGGGRGNVLVDAPRFSPVLAKQVAALGGVEWIFLTHKDDVADHAKWAAHFGARRIIHEAEATAHQGTDQCEVKLTGRGPWAFPDGDEDLTIVHTPGHTSDHCVLFSARHKALFSGDHLSGVEEDASHWRMDGRLFIFDEFNWWSVPEQVASVQKLLDYDWLHVLPGHGAPAALKDASERLRQVAALVEYQQARGASAKTTAGGAPDYPLQQLS